MIQKRHTFCLRIPWLFAPASRISKSEDKSKFPTHSDTNVPIKRPTSPTTKNSPSHHTQAATTITTSVIIESSSVPSQPRTPATPFHSPLPSRAGSPSRVSIASSSPRTRPQSPFHLASDGIIEVAMPAAEESFWSPASSAFEQDKERVVFEEPMPQEAEPKASSPLKAIPESRPDTSFQHENMEIQPHDAEHKAYSVPSTPVSKTELASDQSSSPLPPPSPPLTSEHTGEALKRNVDESNLNASLASQEEKEMVEAESKLVPQETKSKEKSPMKAITKSQETEQKASSEPSTPVSKTESASNQPSHTSSPLEPKHTDEILKHNAEENAFLASPTSQEENENVKSPLKTIPKSPETSFQHERIVAQPQDSEQKTSSIPSSPVSKADSASDQSPLTSEHISNMLKHKSPEISSNSEILYTWPTPSTRVVERSPTPKTKNSDLDGIAGRSKASLETHSKLLESQEMEKEVHEPIKARKASDIISIGQPIQPKDPFTMAFRADKKQQYEACKTVARRLVSATSKLRERDIKFMSSTDQMTRMVSSILPEKSALQNGIKNDVSKFVHKLTIVEPVGIKGDDVQFSAINLAGENRGATMQLDSDATKKEGSINIQEESIDVITDLEENTKKESHCLTMDDGVGKAYVNSNVQSINNSLMVHGSITETR